MMIPDLWVSWFIGVDTENRSPFSSGEVVNNKPLRVRKGQHTLVFRVTRAGHQPGVLGTTASAEEESMILMCRRFSVHGTHEGLTHTLSLVGSQHLSGPEDLYHKSRMSRECNGVAGPKRQSWES